MKEMYTTGQKNACVCQGTPQVTEMFVDSKRDVDQQLKSTCEDFIRLVTDMFTVPLTTFLSRVS